MNAWPTLREWMQFGGTLALEVLIVFAVAKLLMLRVRSAQGRRALWQITLLAMLLVGVGELNGVRGWLRLPEKKISPPAVTTKKVVVTFKDVEPGLEQFPDFAPAAIPPQPASRPSRWQERAVWPARLWAALAVLVLLRMIIAQGLALRLRLASHRSSGQPCPLNISGAEGTADMAIRRSVRAWRNDDSALLQRLGSLAPSLGVRRNVVLLTSERTIVPFTFGVWRPVIVLPQNFTTTFTPEQQDAALAHELAHVANFDSAWRTLSQFACAVLWWHPLVWLAKRELDHASELVADEASLLVANGPDRLAECLLACAKELRRPALAGWLGMDGGGFRSALGKRVTRLLQLNPHARLSRPVPWYLRLLAPVVCVALLWLGMAAVMKSGAPRGGAWRASILGSAFAAAQAIKPSVSAATTTNSTTVSNLSDLPHLGKFFRSPESNRIETARLVEEGRRFYEVGQLHAARTNLQAALLFNPTNYGALYYLDLVNAREQAAHERLAARQRLAEANEFPVETSIPTNLQTRLFNMVPNALEEGLASISGLNQSTGGKKPVFNLKDTNSVTQRVQRLFKMAGVNLSAPGREVLYQDRTGVMMVRATPAEMDTVEKAIQFLNMTPPQLTIRVKVFEIAKTNAAQGFDWFLGTVLTNPPPRNRADPNAAVPTITSILTEWQFRDVVRALEQRGGTDMLIASEVTTLSGRQAQIKVVDIQYIVTDLDIDATNSKTKQPVIAPMAEPFELGPVIDVIPQVQPDGYTIYMTVIPSLKEFLGYEDPQTVRPAIAGAAQANGVTSPMPLPKFRLRQVATSAMVWDGQTLMIGAGTARTMQRDRDEKGVITTNYTEKELIYFITPRLVDPAGNPLHADDEFPERHKTVPAQRTGGGKP